MKNKVYILVMIIKWMKGKDESGMERNVVDRRGQDWIGKKY